MYMSSANSVVGVGALQLIYSDDGTTWSAPVNVANGATFIRNVQITGDLLGSALGSNVYIAGMDEGGGALNTRLNHMYRSTDGGVTWSDHAMTATRFAPPGRSTSGYSALMYPGIWRHMGWGQPAAVGPVVHYAYAQCGGAAPCSTATDAGNIMYTRSTDSG